MAANIRLLRRRIKTAKNIAQITRAMEMVAASKVRRAQEKTLAGKPYTTKLRSVVQNLAGRIEEGGHPYLTKREKGKTLVLLFSSDKGLCGSLNTSILREFLRFKGEQHTIEVVSIGKKLERAVPRSGSLVLADFPFGTTLPVFESVLPISKLVIDGFAKKEYKEVICIYMQFITLASQKPTILPLLPIQREGSMPETIPYTFEPNTSDLLTALMPHFLEMSLYQIFLEQYASEQAARRLAMHQASENAKDVIWELSLYYNKARQERITSELLDITSGMVGGMSI